MIHKLITTANGPASFHFLRKMESGPPFAAIALTVDSYAAEEVYAAGGNFLYRNQMVMPVTIIDGNLGAVIENWLVTDIASILQGGQIVTDKSDTLDAKRSRKVAEMTQRCSEAILGGFESSALGAAHTYPAKVTDQANLTGSVLRSFYPDVDANWATPFWCQDSAGVWAYRDHSAVQIQRVGDDAIAARLACMGYNESLAAQIMVATEDELAALLWDLPAPP